MNSLIDCKEDIHSCSKCGLCQSVCPVYKVTGNDCTVSRGHFIMLRGLLKGELKMSKTINRYLDLCLKCGACNKFCPSAIDVVEIVAFAKAEYFNKSHFQKFISFLQKNIVFGLGLKFLSLFSNKAESKKFEKKVVFFGGCKNKLSGNSAVVKILNNCNIEVITPDFDCCGMPYFVRGDMKNFQNCMDSFFEKLKATGIYEVVTTCASCEKNLKSYLKYSEHKDFSVKNIFEYMRENNFSTELKKRTKVTFHKPCNIDNYDDIKYILKHVKNLEYIEMQDYDKCCGLNGILNFSEYKILKNIFLQKRNNIIFSEAKTVLTSCLGCEFALQAFSFGKYKVEDLIEFLGRNIK